MSFCKEINCIFANRFDIRVFTQKNNLKESRTENGGGIKEDGEDDKRGKR